MDKTELDNFEKSLRANMHLYGVDLSQNTRAQLGAYFDLLQHWNSRLHLVAPCSTEEFATRHILESLLLLKFLPPDATVADVGSGAGLPIIPCLIALPGLKATLIESSQRKSIFLRETLKQLGQSDRASVIARPFEHIEPGDVDFVTCRALDAFMKKVNALINWAPASSTLLLFGGATLRQRLRDSGTRFTESLIPSSEKRFLFEVRKGD